MNYSSASGLIPPSADVKYSGYLEKSELDDDDIYPNDISDHTWIHRDIDPYNMSKCLVSDRLKTHDLWLRCVDKEYRVEHPDVDVHTDKYAVTVLCGQIIKSGTDELAACRGLSCYPSNSNKPTKQELPLHSGWYIEVGDNTHRSARLTFLEEKQQIRRKFCFCVNSTKLTSIGL